MSIVSDLFLFAVLEWKCSRSPKTIFTKYVHVRVSKEKKQETQSW